MANATNNDSETMSQANVTNANLPNNELVENRTQSVRDTDQTQKATFPLANKFRVLSGETPIVNIPYKITVNFDSLTVNEDHDHFGIRPASCCSGEWMLFAWVQGTPIILLPPNDRYLVFGHGQGSGYTLDDGDTVYFQDKQLTVDVPQTTDTSKTWPLSIATFGVELDCGFEDLEQWVIDRWPQLDQVITQPQSNTHNWQQEISKIQAEEKEATEGLEGSTWCNHIVLGSINKVYLPPGQSYEPIGYGAGAHLNIPSSTDDFILRYTINVVPPPPPSVTGVEPCDDHLGINTATASSSQNPIFGPEKAIDNDLTSYWFSNFTLNPYIILDLGAQRPLCTLHIAWQDGNTHQYRFSVGVSKNGTSYTNVFSGSSSGSTSSPEGYDIGGVEGRYVKITITQSYPGSPNSLARISEIDLFGKFTGNDPGGPGEGPVIANLVR